MALWAGMGVSPSISVMSQNSPPSFFMKASRSCSRELSTEQYLHERYELFNFFSFMTITTLMLQYRVIEFVHAGEFFIWDVLMTASLWVSATRRACGGGVSLRRMISTIRGLSKLSNSLLFTISEQLLSFTINFRQYS